MAQDPEYFFLQTKLSGEWDTLKESQSITDLTQNISENLNDLTETKIRIVGAIWNGDKNEWDYEQLFYSESSSEIAWLNRTPQMKSSDTVPPNKQFTNRISMSILIKFKVKTSHPYQRMLILYLLLRQ